MARRSATANRADVLRAVGATDNILPAYAWPGGYPICYLSDDGETFCQSCANGHNGSECLNADPAHGWGIVGWFIHWEGEPERCVHCNAEIESAYGNPDDDGEDDACHD